jgi:DNA-binding MarR family transcriptional regulator
MATNQPADRKPHNDGAYDDVVETLGDVFGQLMRLTTDDWINIDISTAQIKVLFVLHFGGMHTVNQLADRLNIKQSTASHLVEKLVRAGFVARIDSTTDRRISELHLTEQGQALADRLSGITQKRILAQWVSQLTEDQHTAFGSILHALLAIIRKSSGGDL